MKYCNKCGVENNSKANFCESCGNKLTNTFQKNFSGNKSIKVILSVVVSLVIIFVGYMSYSYLNGNSNEKGEFLSTYDKATDYTKKADFKESKLELEKLVNKKSYDKIDVKKDIEIDNKLLEVSNTLKEETSSEKLLEQISKIEKEYSNSSSEIYEASEQFRKEVKAYSELLGDYVKLKQYIDNNDSDNANKELEKIKGYRFKLSVISDIVSEKISELEKDISNIKKVTNTESSNNGTSSTNKVEGSNAISEDPLDRDYERWSSKIPNAEIFKENGRWMVIDGDGMKYAVIYDFEGQVRLVNARRNVHINY